MGRVQADSRVSPLTQAVGRGRSDMQTMEFGHALMFRGVGERRGGGQPSAVDRGGARFPEDVRAPCAEAGNQLVFVRQSMASDSRGTAIEDAHDFHVVLPLLVGSQDFVVERRTKGRDVVPTAFRKALESLVVADATLDGY
jgi:hypothetical protein